MNLFIICTKSEFSNSQLSTITGITSFPDEELFILALYFALLQQPISIPTFSSASFNYYFGLFCEVMFMISQSIQFQFLWMRSSKRGQQENNKDEFDVYVFTVFFVISCISSRINTWPIMITNQETK